MQAACLTQFNSQSHEPSPLPICHPKYWPGWHFLSHYLLVAPFKDPNRLAVVAMIVEVLESLVNFVW